MGSSTCTPARNRFDELRLDRIVTKSSPETLDGGIEAVLEIDKCAVGPQPTTDVLSSNDLAGPFEQKA